MELSKAGSLHPNDWDGSARLRGALGPAFGRFPVPAGILAPDGQDAGSCHRCLRVLFVPTTYVNKLGVDGINADLLSDTGVCRRSHRNPKGLVTCMSPHTMNLLGFDR